LVVSRIKVHYRFVSVVSFSVVDAETIFRLRPGIKNEVEKKEEVLL